VTEDFYTGEAGNDEDEHLVDGMNRLQDVCRRRPMQIRAIDTQEETQAHTGTDPDDAQVQYGGQLDRSAESSPGPVAPLTSDRILIEAFASSANSS